MAKTDWLLYSSAFPFDLYLSIRLSLSQKTAVKHILVAWLSYSTFHHFFRCAFSNILTFPIYLSLSPSIFIFLFLFLFLFIFIFIFLSLIVSLFAYLFTFEVRLSFPFTLFWSCWLLLGLFSPSIWFPAVSLQNTWQALS